jgi:hypothetical protein
MKRVFVTALCIVGFGGCAALQASDARWTEQALTAAGFQVVPADTPEKLAQITALTPRTLMRQSQQGEVRYVYADPTTCKCLYVGGELEYQRFRRHEETAVDQVFDNGGGATWGARSPDRRFLKKLEPLDEDDCPHALGTWDLRTEKCDLPEY